MLLGAIELDFRRPHCEFPTQAPIVKNWYSCEKLAPDGYRPARRAPLGAADACLPPRGDEPHVRPLALVVLPHPSARGLPAGLCPS